MELETNNSSDAPIFVSGRRSVVGPNRIDDIILEALEKRAEAIVRQNQSNKEKIDPTLFITLDKLKELDPALLQIKFVQGSLEKILDISHRGENRAAYLYPYLIQDSKKIVAKLALIVPHIPGGTEKVDVSRHRKATFEFSVPVLNTIIQNLKQKPTAATRIGEKHPGDILITTQNDGKKIFIPDRLSLERQIRATVANGFTINEAYAFRPIPIPEFEADVVAYYLKNRQVEMIDKNYHIVVDTLEINDDGSYKRPPEVIAHYRAQADALETYSLPILREIAEKKSWAQFLQKVNEFKEQFAQNVTPGREQNKERTEALITLIGQFPFDQVDKSIFSEIHEFREKINWSLSILQNLASKKDLLVERLDQQRFDNLLSSLKNKIIINSSQNGQLTLINSKQAIIDAQIKDESRYNEYIRQLQETLDEELAFIADETNPQNRYYVDHGYLLFVMESISRKIQSDKRMSKHLEMCRKIEKKYSNDKLLNAKIDVKQKSELAAGIVRNEQNVEILKKKEESQSKYNIGRGVLASIVGLITFITLMIINASLWPAFFLIAPVCIMMFFKKTTRNRHSLDSENDEVDEDDIVPDAQPDEKKEKRRELNAKMLETVEGRLVPKRFDKLIEKVFSEQDILDHKKAFVQEIPQLKKIEKDDEKFLTAITHSLQGKYLRINIDKKISSKGFPTAVYFLRNDFFNDRIRDNYSEDYRSELKETRDQNKQQYLQFLINTLEMNYYKYKSKVQK